MSDEELDALRVAYHEAKARYAAAVDARQSANARRRVTDRELADELAAWTTHVNEIPFGYFESAARVAGADTPRACVLAFFARLVGARLVKLSPHNEQPAVDGSDPDAGWVLAGTATDGKTEDEAAEIFLTAATSGA